jgi:hypothetical protein
MTRHNGHTGNAVYVQTNDAAGNEVLMFERRADGVLGSREAVATGGRGTGEPHLPSQSSIALSRASGSRTAASSSCRGRRGP